MPASQLIRIGELALDAQDLSRMTYGNVPRDDGSPGAVWLRAVASAYLSGRKEMLAEDEETRDSIVDRMSGQLSPAETWAVVTDLKLYAEAEDDRFDYGLWSEAFDYTNSRTFKREAVFAVRKNELTSALG